MKKFAKLTALILAVMMVACVCAGCGGSEEKDVKLTILDTEYVQEDYAICVAKNNEDLLNKINTALDELTKEGKIKEIVDKYIK